MSKISQKRRQFQIKRKRKTREKIKKLKEKYSSAKSKKEKEQIIEKMKKISPFLPVEEILNISKNKKTVAKKEK